MNFHWVLRTRFGQKYLEHRETCVDVWHLLRRIFPSAHAAVIMPDHAHWICREQNDLRDIRYALTRGLNRIGRKYDAAFEPIPTPELIPDHRHLLRQVRYVHLNPCRSSLAKDPIEWEWSTHADVLGSVTHPWIDHYRLFQDLKIRKDLVWFHRYVSSDPTVDVQGSSLLQDALPDFCIGLDDLIRAILFYYRASIESLSSRPMRGVLVQVARRMTYARVNDLSERLKVSMQTIRNDQSTVNLIDEGGIRRILSLIYDVRTLKMLRRIEVTSGEFGKKPKIDNFWL